MDSREFQKIGKELQKLSKVIPLHWGVIQNDNTDAKLNLFNISSKDDLETKINKFSEKDKNYYRRRWFLWQCSKVDEYLFYSQDDIKKNPNSRDQNWDIEFNHNTNLRFDVKGTVVPKKFQDNFSFSEEAKIINFYYEQQSKGVRDHLQNRLFVVHHSFYKTERSIFLRCHWDLKAKAYQHFYHLLKSDINFISYKTVIAKCIFIFESTDKVCSFKIL